MLESMLTNFKGVANALEEFIEKGGSLPPNQTEEGLDGDIVSGEKDIESGFTEGARTAPIGMILVTPDKDINTINREHSRPTNHIAKDDEGWKKNGQYSLNNALLNSSEFLRNLDLQEGTHEVVFRVKEDQDAKFLEDPNQTIINTYYVDPNTGEEIFVGRLPAYNFDQQGNPKEMSYLAELRKDIIKREKLLKEASKEDTKETNIAEQIVNTINKIKDIDSKIAEAEKGAIEVSETTQPQATQQDLDVLIKNALRTGILSKSTKEDMVFFNYKDKELQARLSDEKNLKQILETNPELVEDILNGMYEYPSYKELQKIAKEKGLNAKGKKIDIIKRLKEFDASEQAEPTRDFKSEIKELNKEKEGLLETLSSLQESMPKDLKPDLEEEAEVFGALADIKEAEFTEIESKIEEAQKKAEEKFSKEELEKAKIIDEKFEDIVEAIIKSKINLFFDGSTSVEANHRKC
jgi:hypothetical protein